MAKVRKSAQNFDFSPPPGFRPSKEKHPRKGADNVRRPDPVTSYGGYRENTRSEMDHYQAPSSHDSGRYGQRDERGGRVYGGSDRGNHDRDYDRPRKTRDQEPSRRNGDWQNLSNNLRNMEISRADSGKDRAPKSRVQQSTSELGGFYDGARTKTEYFEDGLANQYSSNRRDDPMEDRTFQKDFKKELEQNIRNRSTQKKWEDGGEPVQNLRQMQKSSDMYTVDVIAPAVDYDDDEPVQNLRQNRYHKSDQRIDSGYDSKVHSREPSWTDPAPVEDKYRDNRHNDDRYQDDRSRALYGHKKESISKERPRDYRGSGGHDNGRQRYNERTYDDYHDAPRKDNKDVSNRDHKHQHSSHDQAPQRRYDEGYDNDPYRPSSQRVREERSRPAKQHEPRGRPQYYSDDDSMSPPRHREKKPQRTHDPPIKQKKQNTHPYSEFTPPDEIVDHVPSKARNARPAQDKPRERRHAEEAWDNPGRGGGNQAPRGMYGAPDTPTPSPAYKPQPVDSTPAEEPIDPAAINRVAGWLEEDTNLFSGY